MLKIETDRLIGFSDMVIEDKKIKTIKLNSINNSLLNLKPTTGRESGFVFYTKDNTDNIVCHVGITEKRNKFEVSYGTETAFRGKGYMCEALVAFLNWVKENLAENDVWGLPNGPESEHILEKCGFDFYGNVEKSSSKWYRFTFASDV